VSAPDTGLTPDDKALIETITGRQTINAHTIRSLKERAPDGACASCGVGMGHHSPTDGTVTCLGCGLPWPSDYWGEQ
jgi:hypothetical protein